MPGLKPKRGTKNTLLKENGVLNDGETKKEESKRT
jgi:hypothetical protein